MAVILYKRWGRSTWFAVGGLWLLVVCGLWLTAFSPHPYYVSVTELEYKPAEKEVQIAGKIFIDDLELALAKEFNTKVSILNSADKKKNEDLLNRFFQKHVQISVEGKPVAYTFIGFEREEEAIWSYLVIKNIPKLKTATVVNDLLYAQRQDQINIIHFVNNGNRKSHRLTYPDKQVTFKW